MTVLYTNAFTGADGSAPTDFVLSQSPTGGTQDIQSNRFRQQTNQASQAIRAILPAGSWSKADGRVRATFTTQNPVGAIVPQIYARTSGDWSTEIDTPTTCYKLIWTSASGLMLFKRTGGTTTQLGSSFAFSLSVATTYYLTLQCVGTAIKGRIGTTADPGTWQIEVTDSSVAGPGQFQVALLSQAAGTLRVDWDDVSLDDLLTPATVASGSGAALFTASGGSSSVTITATDPVSGYGTALTPGGSSSTNLSTPPTAVGAANTAGVSVSGGGASGFPFATNPDGALTYATSPPLSSPELAYNFLTGQIELIGASASDVVVGTALASSTGAANNVIVATSASSTPTAATGVGVANAPTVTAVSSNVAAGCATGTGDATGISYLLDGNGDPILDENNLPIEDGYSLAVHVAPNATALAGTAAATAATTKVAAGVQAATAVGSAPLQSIAVSGATTVNAAAATSTGAANSSAATVASQINAATSAGAANTTQSAVQIYPTTLNSAGVAWSPEREAIAEPAVASGGVDAPQIDVLANNFTQAAAIPIAASAPNPHIHISVEAGIVAVGVAYPANQSTNEPGQLISLRDQGHTVTVKER